MGRNKANLHLGGRTMLGHIKAAAQATGLSVRVIKKDLVPKCGPLGGVYTALENTASECILFLACDMPFASRELLQLILRRSRKSSRAWFVRTENGAGFPFVLKTIALPTVRQQISRRKFSLQNLALALGVKPVRLPRVWSPQLRNVNTPEDLEETRALWRAG
jgi:molybdopterin-guanine dinucleotide biosynthesis protein A